MHISKRCQEYAYYGCGIRDSICKATKISSRPSNDGTRKPMMDKSQTGVGIYVDFCYSRV